MNDDAGKLRALLDFGARVDGLVEASLRARRSLADALQAVLPALAEVTGARGAFAWTFDEDLRLGLFAHPAELTIPGRESVFERAGAASRERVEELAGEDLVVAQPLDVAGEWFGVAGLVLPREAAQATDPAHLAALLEVACEEVDNFLYAIRAAREKHRVLMDVNAALRHLVLGEGLREAVRVLAGALPLERLLLVCVAQDDPGVTPHVQVFQGASLVFDTMGGDDSPEEPAIRREAGAYLRRGERELLERFGFQAAQEEVLISGVRQATVLGKVLATSRTGVFNTYDRDLLGGFAGFIGHRVVDFNKEWRTLAVSFNPLTVERLLQEDDYARRYLAPREAEVAMLYVDIAGFTRLSEQVLQTPSRVAALVEAWSRDAVRLVWEHDGVFDKMVGDCVIALFGPPFYETTPGARLRAAIRCAQAIRAMTAALPERAGFEALRGSGVGVSTGVNLAPLFVGRFGPNDNFTGFSSGMNNTARLQGLAVCDEILIMADALAALPAGHGMRFGPERSAKVKNVAEPLRYHALLGELPDG